MRWHTSYGLKLRNHEAVSKKWFAWRPYTLHGETRWLETVEVIFIYFPGSRPEFDKLLPYCFAGQRPIPITDVWGKDENLGAYSRSLLPVYPENVAVPRMNRDQTCCRDSLSGTARRAGDMTDPIEYPELPNPTYTIGR